MEAEIVLIVCLILLNICAVAYSYGRLTQKVKDNARRLDKIEKIINTRGST